MYRWGIGKLIIKGRRVVFCINFYFFGKKKKGIYIYSKFLIFLVLGI